MVRGYDTDVVDDVLAAETNDEISALGLSDDDTEILRRLSSADRERSSTSARPTPMPSWR